MLDEQDSPFNLLVVFPAGDWFEHWFSMQDSIFTELWPQILQRCDFFHGWWVPGFAGLLWLQPKPRMDSHGNGSEYHAPKEKVWQWNPNWHPEWRTTEEGVCTNPLTHFHSWFWHSPKPNTLLWIVYQSHMFEKQRARPWVLVCTAQVQAHANQQDPEWEVEWISKNYHAEIFQEQVARGFQVDAEEIWEGSPLFKKNKKALFPTL